jgi:hypothetical protein
MTLHAAKRGQPTGAPHSVAVDGIQDGYHKEAADHECRELPSFGHRSGRNRCRRVHEKHKRHKIASWPVAFLMFFLSGSGGKRHASPPFCRRDCFNTDQDVSCLIDQRRIGFQIAVIRVAMVSGIDVSVRGMKYGNRCSADLNNTHFAARDFRMMAGVNDEAAESSHAVYRLLSNRLDPPTGANSSTNCGT